ncbi:MAG: crossover junction endodeoxyribonuclease RuvC [Firmicutes bacterium]|nr:crossover junction endodeoxyribonuclease RuvC [Bacillota bacterium]
MMIILGIDPGIGIMGYGIVRREKDGSITHIENGALCTPSNEEVPARLAMIYERVVQLIKAHNPDAIVIEDLFFGRNVTNALKVAAARGVIMLASAHHTGKIYEIKPNHVKMAITGTAKSKKPEIQEMVKNILKLDKIPKPDDAADALAVAIAFIDRLSKETNL